MRRLICAGALVLAACGGGGSKPASSNSPISVAEGVWKISAGSYCSAGTMTLDLTSASNGMDVFVGSFDCGSGKQGTVGGGLSGTTVSLQFYVGSSSVWVAGGTLSGSVITGQATGGAGSPVAAFSATR